MKINKKLAKYMHETLNGKTKRGNEIILKLCFVVVLKSYFFFFSLTHSLTLDCKLSKKN